MVTTSPLEWTVCGNKTPEVDDPRRQGLPERTTRDDKYPPEWTTRDGKNP